MIHAVCIWARLRAGIARHCQSRDGSGMASVQVADVDGLKPGEMKCVLAGQRRVALARLDDGSSPATILAATWGNPCQMARWTVTA